MENIVLVPLTHLETSLFLPTPWAHLPNSLERERVKVVDMGATRSLSIFNFVPVIGMKAWFSCREEELKIWARKSCCLQ